MSMQGRSAQTQTVTHVLHNSTIFRYRCLYRLQRLEHSDDSTVRWRGCGMRHQCRYRQRGETTLEGGNTVIVGIYY